MFKLFRRNEVRKLEAEYRKKLEVARDLQRRGDIEGFAAAMAKAEDIGRRIDDLKNPQ